MNRPFALRFPFSIRSLPLAFVLALALTLALTLASASIAAADGIIIPHPPPDQPISWRDIPLAIKYHRVDVTIIDQVATTKVDQVFVNEAELSGRGHLHLPAARGRRDLQLRHVGGRAEAGGQAAGPRRGPRHLRGHRAPPARSGAAGVRGPRRVPGQHLPHPARRRAPHRADLQPGAAADGRPGALSLSPQHREVLLSAIDEVAVTVHLADKAPIRAIYSPSHPVEVVREGDRRATVSYEAQNVRPDRDFDLYYSLSSDAVAVNLLSYKPFDEDGFFLLLVTPPVEAAGQAVAKDVVLVLDTSGSMDGEKIIQAKAAADYVLDHLGEDDRFNIVAFSTATRLFSDRPVPAAAARRGPRVRPQPGGGRLHRHQPGAAGGAGGRRRRTADGAHLPDRWPAHGRRGGPGPDRRQHRGRGAEVGAAVRLRRGLRRRHRPARSAQQRPARDQHLREAGAEHRGRGVRLLCQGQRTRADRCRS